MNKFSRIASKSFQSASRATFRHREAMEALIDYCPMQIGDTTRVQSYAYSGRLMRITRIIVADNGTHRAPVWGWHITGEVLKKDGTPHRGAHGEAFVPFGEGEVVNASLNEPLIRKRAQ